LSDTNRNTSTCHKFDVFETDKNSSKSMK